MSVFSLFTALLISFTSNDLISKKPLIEETTHYSFLGEYNNGYPEYKYNEVLDTFLQIYGPVVQARGGSLHFLKDWSDGAVNMWAWKWGKEYWLEIPGGMSRYFLINEEAFILSICHELGHLLGGAPYKGDDISLEGQSDFYSTRSCTRKVLHRIVPYKSNPIEADTRSFCARQPHLPQNDCERSVSGALSLSSYYAKLEKVSPPKISTPSQAKVTSTLKTHPPAQCRFDTFLAGLSCEDDNNCNRPSCWYAKD